MEENDIFLAFSQLHQYRHLNVVYPEMTDLIEKNAEQMHWVIWNIEHFNAFII